VAALQRLGSKSARDQVLSEDRSRLAKNCREEYALRKKPQLSSVSDDEFAQVVRLAPLVSIDLVICKRHVLVGLQNNEPAKAFILYRAAAFTTETIEMAFTRIVQAETGCRAQIENARFLGVFQHFYAGNRYGEHGYGTHANTKVYV